MKLHQLAVNVDDGHMYFTARVTYYYTGGDVIEEVVHFLQTTQCLAAISLGQ